MEQGRGPKEVTITIRVEESLRDDLQRIAKECERTFSSEARRALRHYVWNYDINRSAA